MIIEIIGYLSMTILLTGYFLFSTGKITKNIKIYHLMNAFGSLGILVNAFSHGAMPSVILNLVFLLIAIYGAWKALPKKE